MIIGGGSIRLRGVLVACVALLLLVVTGCSAGNDSSSRGGESESFAGPAPATMAPGAPLPEAPPEDSPVAKGPDIVTTGSVRMTVSDPAAAADKFAAATIDAGGRVENRNEQSGSSRPTVDMTLRIPSDKVDAVLANIDELGVVESKSINYDDVTAQRVDLDARIKALQTSVNRLLELMSKATNTADLLAAETSLTERQAELDSLRAQRATLGDQIAYATISVSLAAEPTVSRGGFGGAMEQGWQALVSLGTGLALTFAFLIPWLPLIAVLAVVFWWLVRRQRRRAQAAPRGWPSVPAAQPAPVPVATPPAPAPAPESTPKAGDYATS